MDIVGLGTDIVECLRVGRMIDKHGERFLQQAFTCRETRFCNERKRPLEHFASIWAAKEAILKSLGLAGRGLNWTDVEVCQEGNSRPEVRLFATVRDAAEKQGVGTVLLTMAHCRAYATAYALAVRGVSGG
jgi:holo-[acyl-carrier protein] synthase